MATVEEAVRLLADTALVLVEQDPHMFSTRPCSSCSAISRLVGRRFGCDAVRAGDWRHYRPQDWTAAEPAGEEGRG